MSLTLDIPVLVSSYCETRQELLGYLHVKSLKERTPVETALFFLYASQRNVSREETAWKAFFLQISEEIFKKKKEKSRLLCLAHRVMFPFFRDEFKNSIGEKYCTGRTEYCLRIADAKVLMSMAANEVPAYLWRIESTNVHEYMSSLTDDERETFIFCRFHEMRAAWLKQLMAKIGPVLLVWTTGLVVCLIAYIIWQRDAKVSLAEGIHGWISFLISLF